MKKLLLILLCLPMIGFGQQTYVPDDNFEQALINLGYDNVLDDYVTTASIDTVTYLNIDNQGIADLTGIEDFTVLKYLDCSLNNLDSLDMSFNVALTYLNCFQQMISYLNVSQNINLQYLNCGANYPITSLDLSNNIDLQYLYFSENDVASLDLSNNINLQYLYLGAADKLNSLDLRNGNNNFLIIINCYSSHYLTCINVDDAVWSTANWIGANFGFDPQTYFSNNCPPSAIQEHTTNKELLKVTDLLGRETKQTNQPLFYIYDDGTVEKRIVIE